MEILCHAANRKADFSAERGVNENGDRNEWKRRGIFLLIFYHPRFASGYDQIQLIITDISKEKKRRVVPKLMITVPKWNKRNNQQESINDFINYWTRIPGWLTGMPKVIERYRKPEKWLKTELSISNRWRIEQKVIFLETSKTND